MSQLPSPNYITLFNFLNNRLKTKTKRTEGQKNKGEKKSKLICWFKFDFTNICLKKITNKMLLTIKNFYQEDIQGLLDD